MEREIKFRGKCVVNGEWVYGYIKKTGSEFWILNETTDWHEMPPLGIIKQHKYKVDPETVGEYTGLKNKNGKEIYEGDILRYPPKDKWEENNFVAFEVFFHDNDCADRHIGFQMNRLHFHGSVCGHHMLESFLPRHTKGMEIIGNIHDNPDLLEVKP